MASLIQIQLTRTEIYDLCDALTTEAERFERLLQDRTDAPAIVKRGWSQDQTKCRELSRRLISECFSGVTA